MKIAEITKREAELIRLCVEAKNASKAFAEASPTVVRRYIAAMASEKANTVIAEAEQLVLLFQAMPTLTEQAG